MKATVRHTGAVAVAAAGALSLTACGFGGNGGGGEGGSTQLDLLVPTYSDNTTGLWEDVIADFEAEHEDITVNLQVESWENINDVIRTQVQAGEAPDILNIDAFAGYVEDDLLYPVEEVMSAERIEDFQPSFVENASMDGTQYGIPLIASARTLFYNQDLLDEAGVSEPPSTWDELHEASLAVADLGGGIAGYGMPLGSEEAQAETALWFFGSGGSYGDQETLTIDSPENVEAAEFMAKMIEDGATQPDAGASDRTPLINIFIQGQIGMIVGLPPTLDQIAENNPELNYGTAPVPTQDGEPMTLGVADHMMAFRNDEDKAEEIQAFLDFFFAPEQYVTFVDTENFIPTTQSGAEELGDKEAIQPFLEVLPGAQFYPSTNPQWSAAQAAIQANIGRLAQGADPAELLAELQASAEG